MNVWGMRRIEMSASVVLECVWETFGEANIRVWCSMGGVWEESGEYKERWRDDTEVQPEDQTKRCSESWGGGH